MPIATPVPVSTTLLVFASWRPYLMHPMQLESVVRVEDRGQLDEVEVLQVSTTRYEGIDREGRHSGVESVVAPRDESESEQVVLSPL